MPNSATQRGRRNRRAGSQREQEWADHLTAQGCEVGFRHRSKSERQTKREQPYDLIATKGGDIVVWEVKSTAAGPFSDFGPAKREACIQAALRAGGSPCLVWWPYDRQGPRVYSLEQWPEPPPETHEEPVNGGFDVWPEEPQ